MRGLAVIVSVLAAATSGCVSSSLVTCDDGWSCPAGTACADTTLAGDVRCVSTTCGDGAIGVAEDCDGSELGGRTCTDHGFYGGELACNPATCRYETSGCEGRCGDRVVNGDEQCDGSELVTTGCTMLGARFDIGRPGCTDQCTFDISTCGYLGFDPIYGGSAAIKRFCAYEPTPGDVVAHLIEGSSVIRLEGGADTPLPALLNADDFGPREIACSPGELAVIRDGMRSFDGTAWQIVPFAPAPDNAIMLDVAAYGDSLVSVGYGGLIITGSGAGWTVERHAPDEEPLQSVWIDPTTQRGYAAASSGTLLQRTVTNGVATWATLALAAPLDTVAMWGTSDDDVLAITTSLVARLIGGAWITQPVPPGPMHSTGADAIFIAGADGRLSHFDGRLWSRSVDTVGAFKDVWVASDRSVIGAIGAELVRATAVWLSLTSPVAFLTVEPRPGELHDVWTISVYGVMRNGVAYPSVPMSPNALSVADGIAFVAATGGVGRIDPAVGWQTHLIPNVFMSAVAARDGTHAVAVGGTVGAVSATYADGMWSLHSLGIASALTGIAILPSGRALAVGEAGTIVESPDGETWSTIAPGFPVTADLRAVWVAPDGTAVVVGDAGTILHRDSAGVWTAVPSGTSRDLRTVSGTSMSDVFAGGENVLLRFDGVAWTSVRSPVQGIGFRSVHATPHHVYLTASPGAFVLYRAR